jgi:hypothetical protein
MTNAPSLAERRERLETTRDLLSNFENTAYFRTSILPQLH